MRRRSCSTSSGTRREGRQQPDEGHHQPPPQRRGRTAAQILFHRFSIRTLLNSHAALIRFKVVFNVLMI